MLAEGEPKIRAHKTELIFKNVYAVTSCYYDPCLPAQNEGKEKTPSDSYCKTMAPTSMPRKKMNLNLFLFWKIFKPEAGTVKYIHRSRRAVGI